MTDRKYWETEASNFRDILTGMTPEDKSYISYQKALTNCERRLEECDKHELEMNNLENKGSQSKVDNWFDKALKMATIIVPVIGTVITAKIVSASNVKQEEMHQEGQLALQMSELNGGKGMLTAAQNESRRNIPNTKLNIRT